MVRVRGLGVLVVFATLSASLFIGGQGAVAATSAGRLMYAGHGYGLAAGGGGVASQKVANVVGWCRTKPGLHHSNSAASAVVSGVMNVGEMTSTVDGTETSAGKQTVTSTDVHNISLLGGLVTADELKAVSTTAHSTTGFVESDAGAIWSNIVIAGQSLPSQVPAPNTRIDLPAVGYVVLNEQVKTVGASKASFVVNMLHLVTTVDNPVLGTKKGLSILVGHALSGLVEVAGPMGGDAYTSKLTAAGVLSSGPTAVVYLPCAGTDGTVKSNHLGGLGVPSVLGIGSGVNSGSNVVRPGMDKGNISSTVQTIRLLGGAITASAANAAVKASRVNGKSTYTDTSTGLVGLVINGTPYGGDAPPNTKVAIPGVGTLWLHRVVKKANSMRVTMLELKITKSGAGLPVGADLQIASAFITIY